MDVAETLDRMRARLSLHKSSDDVSVASTKTVEEPVVVVAAEDDEDDNHNDAGGEAKVLYHEIMVRAIQDHYAHLLDEEERILLRQFQQLSPDARSCFVRLHSRKYRVFRCSSLKVSRVQNLEKALSELCSAAFATLHNGPIPLGSGDRRRLLCFLRLLRVGELRQLASSVGLSTSNHHDRRPASKDILLTSLSALCSSDIASSFVLDEDSGAQQSVMMPESKKKKGSTKKPLHRQSSLPLMSRSSSSSGGASPQVLSRLEAALRRILCGSTTSSGQQSSLMSFWGAPKPPERSQSAPPVQSSPSLSPKFISTNGFVFVLGHAVCAFFDRIELLYFLNQSSLQTLLQMHLTNTRYPSYTPNRHGCPFQTRDQLLSYVGATHILDAFLRLTDQAGNVSDDVPVPGRSLQLPDVLDRNQYCKRLILSTCVHLMDCIDYTRDPLGDNASFGSLLQSQLEAIRDSPELIDLDVLVSEMHLVDSLPLSPFEPSLDGFASMGLAVAPMQLAGSSPYPDTLAMFVRRFRREYALFYLLRFGLDWLEKSKDYLNALLVLRVLLSLSPRVRHHVQRKLGYFWLRCSLNCAHVQPDKKAAFEVALKSVASEDLSLAYSIKMKQRVVMLARALKKKETYEYPILGELKTVVKREYITGHLLTRKTGSKSAFEGQDGDPISVEELVLQHYALVGGWDGVHTEGRIWRTIWCLLMWPVLFDDTVPFVFQTPYQSAPLDLYTPFFYENRKEAIEAHLQFLRTSSVIGDILRETYAKNYMCITPGCVWDYTPDMLCKVVEGIAPDTLVELLRYGAQCYRSFGKGMPDLCLWRSSGTPRVFLCEVKGPRDRLSQEQEAHLLNLNKMGLVSIVCHVKEQGKDGENVEIDQEGEDENSE